MDNRYKGENARDIYGDALELQNACNLSGVAHTLCDMCSFLVDQGLDTDGIRSHPAVILTVDKMNDLVRRPDLDAYSKADDECRAKRRS